VSFEVAFVGAGWATRERHIPAFRRDSRVRLRGVVDLHGDRAEELARAAKLAHHGSSLDEPWLDGVDAIIVGVPPLEHADVVEAVLDRGAHCLCEKPFVLPAERARGLVERAEGEGLTLAVVHNFQFSVAGRKLFRLVEDGGLGRVLAVYGLQLSNRARRLPHWADKLPGGLFLDEAAHLLYLQRRVLGRLEPRTVDARVDDGEIVHLAATLDHDEIWSTLSMSFESSVSEWQFIVVGDRATAAFDLFRDVLIVLPNDRQHRGREVLRSSAAVVGRHVAGVAASGTRLVRGRLHYGNDEVARRFVDGVLGDQARLEGISGRDGLAVVEALERLLAEAGVGVGRSSGAG
jgi:scyllo-inositol 2-dehydrogenase (NADP+)